MADEVGKLFRVKQQCTITLNYLQIEIIHENWERTLHIGAAVLVQFSFLSFMLLAQVLLLLQVSSSSVINKMRVLVCCLQCLDAVGWATGSASSP